MEYNKLVKKIQVGNDEEMELSEKITLLELNNKLTIRYSGVMAKNPVLHSSR